MSEHGGAAGEPPRIPRSRLADYAEMDESPTPDAPATPSQEHPEPPLSVQSKTQPDRQVSLAENPEVAARRRAFAELLGEFRRTAVLVPLGDGPGPAEERGLLTADSSGVRFLLAFSDEQALARYAQARGEYSREWTYRTILGAKLLDVAVPTAGVPCGVALDCADGPDGMVFPPVRGIVPDKAAVDRDEDQADEGDSA
ncbi:hypothetical protein CG723_24050 [Streptomyces sp. CB01635]|uniref:hypothetical protein n=1 Tax=Streptomyces sp. NPDC000188 TaxID=3154245 RepID=UPI000C271029|nr:hypothetical protein [Streptomyces sp. CB01635]PJN09435.1 hypothetical protein CG723_24050 [Streptomyces sp. CB01635]